MFKKLAMLIAAAMLLTGCSANTESGSGSLTPDQVFSGGATSSDTPTEMAGITSQQLVNNIRIGWNLGLALENYLTPDDTADANSAETLRGNPPATAKMFENLMDSGVNAVRLPITWQDHIGEDGVINDGWLNRVTQVVNYAYDCGMYVIITMYHDGDEGFWLRNAETDRDATLERYADIWKQLAEKFSGYNERVLFESMNAVDFTGLSDDDSYALLNDINQLFVDTIRESGGNNAMRHLLIAGYNADLICSIDERFRMPEDPSERCILSVHYYIPMIYCLDDIQENWGSNTDQIWMESLINQLSMTFTENGIPVIITEYDTNSKDIPSRVFFCEKLTKLCHDKEIATFLWDDGSEFDRKEFTWSTPGLLDGLRRASGSTEYTPVKIK